mmetsp:Transcript_14186/g.26693  ORF Transcript_14186/g.26693 Transcript_14186/m.26693 type:complete len:201 (+) Transcript_14186:3549-4151(+)
MALPVSPDQALLIAQGAAQLTCVQMHSGSCVSHCLGNFYRCFKFLFMFYFPLHAVSLATQPSRLQKQPKETVSKALVSCLRSTVFLSSMVLAGRALICLYLKVHPYCSRKLILTSAVASTLAVPIEAGTRLCEFSMFILPRFLDAVWNYLKRRNIVKSLPGAHLLMFSAAMSAISYAHQHEPANIRSLYSKLCQYVLGVN